MALLDEAKQIENEIIKHRRYLHQHPECGFDLPLTTKYVFEQLKELGYEPKIICKSGIVATIGKNNGKCILLRADMDALPVSEENSLTFKSTNGNNHACGHDIHTSMLLGAAKLLKNHENELNGQVKLMFQPNEEGTSIGGLSGSEEMINNGLLSNPNVDACFSMHIMPGQFKSGSVTTKKGAIMSSVDNVEIHIQGKGTHGSQPENGVDPINIACHIYLALQNLIARELPSYEQAVLTIGCINGGDAPNIITDTVDMRGTLRTTLESTRAHFKERITKIVEETADLFGGKATVEFLIGIPSVHNDEKLTAEVIKMTKELFNDDVIEIDHPLSGSDDISCISHAVPTTYVILGGGSHEEGYIYPLHNPHVMFNESVMYKGCALYTHIALNYLNNHK